MYEKIFKTWSKEREDPSLQSLGDTFYKEIKEYIMQLKNALENVEASQLEIQLNKKQLERVMFMFEDLSYRRLSKMIFYILKSNKNFNRSYLTAEERTFYQHLKQSKNLFNESTKIYSEKHPRLEGALEKSREGRFLLLRFLKPVPKIVGTDLKSYGPFKVEDLAMLPDLNAVSLIKKNIALEIE